MAEWQPIETQPEFNHRPIWQFVRLEGWKEHSGTRWHRVCFGTASILREDNATSLFGYRDIDIFRLMHDGDMDDARVTHWKPAEYAFPAALVEPT